MKTTTLFTAALMLGSTAVWADSPGEPGRSDGGKNPLKNVYFGEQHMHTRNSFDAFTVGVNQTWDQAYAYAKGEEVELSTSGEKMKKRTPYDFVAITDHAEYYGVLKEFKDPKSPLSKSDFAKADREGSNRPGIRWSRTWEVACQSDGRRSDGRIHHPRAAHFDVEDIC